MKPAYPALLLLVHHQRSDARPEIEQLFARGGYFASDLLHIFSGSLLQHPVVNLAHQIYSGGVDHLVFSGLIFTAPRNFEAFRIWRSMSAASANSCLLKFCSILCMTRSDAWSTTSSSSATRLTYTEGSGARYSPAVSNRLLAGSRP